MRLTLVVLTVAMLGGCATANRHVGRAALVTSTLTMLCDGMQTLRMAGTDWGHHWEGNPLMGRRPSVTAVTAYFFGAIALNAAAWIVTPEKYKAPLPLLVTAASAYEIADNNSKGTGVCGLYGGG